MYGSNLGPVDQLPSIVHPYLAGAKGSRRHGGRLLRRVGGGEQRSGREGAVKDDYRKRRKAIFHARR